MGKTFVVEKVEKEEQLKKLYNGSAVTFEGLDSSYESLSELLEFFENEGCNIKSKEIIIYVTKGSYMNEFFGLTGSNAYQDDLSIVSIELDEFDMKEIMAVRMKYFGLFRWFDDIVDNNLDREGKRNPFI